MQVCEGRGVETFSMRGLSNALDLCLAPKKLANDAYADVVYQAKAIVAMTVDRTISTAPDTRMPSPFDKWTHQSALSTLWGTFADIANQKKKTLPQEQIEDDFVITWASIMVVHSLYGCPALSLARQAFESKILNAIEGYWLSVEGSMEGIMTYAEFVRRVRASIETDVQCGPPIGGWIETILNIV